MSQPVPPDIGFILFPGLTQPDLGGPWEVLTRLRHANCHLVAAALDPVVSASAGLAIVPTGPSPIARRST